MTDMCDVFVSGYFTNSEVFICTLTMRHAEQKKDANEVLVLK